MKTIVFAFLSILSFAGCSSKMTVVASDRLLVPVRQVDETTYRREASEACTGWYVPNAVLLDMVKQLEDL